MIWCVLLLFAILIAGFPIYLALLTSGLYLLLAVYHVPVDMALTALYDGVGKFTLTAVPLFLLAGSLMEKSSVAGRLVDSITPWLVKVRGGVPIAAVISNELFGAMSGSAPAAAGTIGRAMFSYVKESNGEKFCLGLFASCGALAIIMPPSIAMILFATATNVSIGALFLAGIVPAAIIGIILAIFIAVSSSSVDAHIKFSLRTAVKKTVEGLPVLLLPAIILGGIYAGLFTPTEAAAVGAVYALILGVVVYRELGIHEVVDCLKDTTKLTAQIFILIAASSVFSQALAVAAVPAALVQALNGLGPYMFLFILNIMLIIVGCFFDPTSAILILAPVVAPLAQSLGIDLVHLGIVFTVNLAIGMFTPPFGLNLFVIQSIFNRPNELIARSVVPFFLVYLVALGIITYFPQLYLWLPRLSMTQ